MPVANSLQSSIFNHFSHVHNKTTVDKEELKHAFVVDFGVRAKSVAKLVSGGNGLKENGQVQFGQQSRGRLTKMTLLFFLVICLFDS